MKNILKDINAVVGVTGCFICSSQGQVLASALPKLFDGTILSLGLGQTLEKAAAEEPPLPLAGVDLRLD